MLDLSIVKPRSLVGRALRAPLSVIPRSAEVRVLQGPLRGKRWIAGASIHRCWLGFYEPGKQKKIAECVRPGMTCYDLGANVGFYTLLFSFLTGPEGLVVAFEPVPENVDLIRCHANMNDCRNIRVESLALSNIDGTANFLFDESSNSTGRLCEEGSVQVQSRRLDTWIAETGVPPPNIVKVDVEGAEASVLEGAACTVLRARPAVFLAVHNQDQHAACCEWLRCHDYDISSLDGKSAEQADELLALPRKRN